MKVKAYIAEYKNIYDAFKAPKDPFAAIRGKRMSELIGEERDLANEFWLRENYLSFGPYYGESKDSLFPSIFRIIDKLRKQLEKE